MNRHMTWGDRQAEAAREKNLARLKKLAASVVTPAETISESSDSETTPKTPANKAALPKQETTKIPVKPAKPAAKAAAKKAAPAKAKKKAKR